MTNKRIFIAIPCLDMLDTEFVQSLVNMTRVGNSSINFATSSLVYDSRDRLAREAIDKESDYVLWLDSDMTFSADLLVDFMHDIEKEDVDSVCGLFFARRPNFDPCVWTKLRMGIGDEAINERLVDIPDEMFEIDACGMAAVLMKTEMINAVMKKNGTAFQPLAGYGEDVSFCVRARKLGFRLWCDPKIEVGHMARTRVTKETYLSWSSQIRSE